VNVALIGVTPMTTAAPGNAGAVEASARALPPPILSAFNSADPLGEMMATLERLNQLSTQHTEKELKQAGRQVQQQLEKFLKLMADAIRRAKQAKHRKKKGFLGKVCSAVASAVGGAIGKALGAITMSPSLGKKIEGFTTGALNFSADLAAFNARFAVALATDGPDAAEAWKDAKAEGKKLWESFQENCLENPDFMEVVGYLAKAGSLAAAVGTGGALGVAAVAVFALCEVDNKTNFVTEVLGEDAGPWVRIGMNAAAYALVGTAGESAAIRILESGTAALEGASEINAGVKLLEEGERQARELRSQADLKETLNKMHQYQRMVDDLLLAMEDHGEDKNRGRQLINGTVQIQAATNEALIVRA
jgi:hypothetical protein